MAWPRPQLDRPDAAGDREVVILKMAADGLQIDRWFRHAAQPWRGWSRVKKADFLAPHCKPSAIGRQQDIAAIFRPRHPIRRRGRGEAAGQSRLAGARRAVPSGTERHRSRGGFDLFRFARPAENASSQAARSEDQQQNGAPRIGGRRFVELRRCSEDVPAGTWTLGDRDDHHAGDTQGGEPRRNPRSRRCRRRTPPRRPRPRAAGIAASGPIQPTGSWIFGQPWRMNAAPHHQPEHRNPGNPATRSFRNKTVAWMRAFSEFYSRLPKLPLGNPLTANTTLLAPKLELGSELTGIIHFGHPSSLWSVLELPDKLPKWPKSTRIDIGCSRVRHGRMDREIAKQVAARLADSCLFILSAFGWTPTTMLKSRGWNPTIVTRIDIGCSCVRHGRMDREIKNRLAFL